MPYTPHGNGSLSTEAKQARLEAHFYHLWQRLSDLENEISELRKDRSALIRRVGGWAIWVLAAILGAIVSKGSTLGMVIHTLLQSTGP